MNAVLFVPCEYPHFKSIILNFKWEYINFMKYLWNYEIKYHYYKISLKNYIMRIITKIMFVCMHLQESRIIFKENNSRAFLIWFNWNTHTLWSLYRFFFIYTLIIILHFFLEIQFNAYTRYLLKKWRYYFHLISLIFVAFFSHFNIFYFI